MAVDKFPTSVDDIQRTMKEVEASQKEHLGAMAQDIFDEKSFIEKVTQKKKELTKMLGKVELSEKKQREIMKTQQMQKLLVSLNRMKTLETDHEEGLKQMGKSLTDQMLRLFDVQAVKQVSPEKKKQSLDPDLKSAMELAYDPSLPALDQVGREKMKKTEPLLLKNFREEVKNYKNASEVWHQRKIPTFTKGGLTADESGNALIQQQTVLKGALQELRKASDYYKRYDTFVKTYSEAFLKAEIGTLRDNLRQVVKKTPQDKDAIRKLSSVLQQAVNFYHTLTTTPSKRLAFQKQWVEKMQYGDLPKTLGNDALPKLFDVSLGVGKGASESVVGTLHFTLDLFSLPVLALYMGSLPAGQRGLASKVLLENNTVAGFVSTAWSLGKAFATDPVGVSSKLGKAIEFAYQEKGSWWETLPYEEKGKILGAVISAALPTMNIKTVEGIKGLGALLKVANKYHIDIGPVLDGKLKLPKLVGPDAVENKIFKALQKKHPEKYQQFFDKNMLLNREFFNSSEGQTLLKDAGFNYLAMGDIGGLGSINKIFGKDAGDETIAVLKMLQQKYKSEGLVVITMSDGDEFMLTSYRKSTLKKARKEFEKLTDKHVFHKTNESPLKKAILDQVEKMKKSIKGVEDDLAVHFSKKYGKDMKQLEGMDSNAQMVFIVKEANAYFEKNAKTHLTFDTLLHQSKTKMDQLQKKKHLTKKEQTSLTQLEQEHKQIYAIKNDYESDAKRMAQEVGGALNSQEVYRYLEAKYVSSMLKAKKLSNKDIAAGKLYLVDASFNKKTNLTELKTVLDQGISKVKADGKQVGSINTAKIAKKERTVVTHDTLSLATLRNALAKEKHFDEMSEASLKKTLPELGFRKDAPVALTTWEFNLGALNNMTGKVMGMSGTEMGDMMLLAHKVKLNEILKKHPGLDAALVQSGGTFSLLLQPKVNFKGVVGAVQDEILKEISAHHTELLKRYLHGKPLLDYLSKIQAKTVPVSATGGAGKNTFFALQSAGKRDVYMDIPQFKGKTLSYVIDNSRKMTIPLSNPLSRT